MSKTPLRIKEKSEYFPTCHHCHIICHIRPNCPKLRSLSTSKVRPPSSSSKTTHICHHCGASGHTRLSCQMGLIIFLKALLPILGDLLKALRFLTQFQRN